MVTGLPAHFFCRSTVPPHNITNIHLDHKRGIGDWVFQYWFYCLCCIPLFISEALHSATKCHSFLHLKQQVEHWHGLWSRAGDFGASFFSKRDLHQPWHARNRPGQLLLLLLGCINHEGGHVWKCRCDICHCSAIPGAPS